MEFKRDKSAGFMVNHLARLFVKSINEGIEPLGSSAGQFPILLLLWEGNKISPTEISRRLDIEKATVTNTLNRMQRDGLIDRTKDPKDARASIISISEKGMSLRDDMLQVAMGINKKAMETITPEDFGTFLRVAQTMISNLSKD